MLRTMKVILIVTVALWGYVGGVFNVIDWDGTIGAVTAATSMATFEGGAQGWQATSNILVIWLGALFITLSKLTAAVLCTWGALQMWQTRNADRAEFAAAKQYALVGCAVAITMLFGGFIVIAETYFELWRSDVLRGPVLDSAFRYAGLIALIAIFVASSDE